MPLLPHSRRTSAVFGAALLVLFLTAVLPGGSAYGERENRPAPPPPSPSGRSAGFGTSPGLPASPPSTPPAVGSALVSIPSDKPETGLVKPGADSAVTVLPRDLSLTFEVLKLTAPATGAEDVGLLGVSYRLGVLAGLHAGISAYGAVTGRRGGFLSLGVSVGYDLVLLDAVRLRAELFAGAGGGSLVTNGGLMLRPSASVLWEGPGFGLGAGYSLVTFPGGGLDRSQPFVVARIPADIGLLFDDKAPAKAPEKTLTAQYRRMRFLADLTFYGTTGVALGAGVQGSSSSKLLGFTFDSFLDRRFFTTASVLASAEGDIDGFKAFRGGIGYSFPLEESIRAEAVFAAVYGGGGNLDTGGGFFLEPAAQLSLQLRPVALRVAVGYLIPASGNFRVVTARFGFGITHDALSPDERVKAPTDFTLDRFPGPRPFRFSVGSTRYFLAGKAATGPAADGTAGLLDSDALSLRFDYFLSRMFYLCGATHWTYAGKSPGYGSALFGFGLRVPVLSIFAWDSRLRVGGGGGGRLAFGSGGQFSGETGLEARFSRLLSLGVYGGYVGGFNGFGMPTLEAALSFSFDIPTKANRHYDPS